MYNMQKYFCYLLNLKFAIALIVFLLLLEGGLNIVKQKTKLKNYIVWILLCITLQNISSHAYTHESFKMAPLMNGVVHKSSMYIHYRTCIHVKP